MGTEQRFDELDGLRGLAALVVALGHLDFAGMTLVPVPISGRIAVWIFFVLSSFLLTRQAMAPEGGQLKWTIQFALRRLFRIYPLYVACIAIDLLARRMNIETAIGYLTLTEPCCGHIYWSVPPELLFYILIPAIGALGAAFPRTAVAVLLSAATLSITYATRYTFFAFASTFCFGSIAAIMLTRWPLVAKRIALAWPLAPLAAIVCSFPVARAMDWQIMPWEWNGMHGALWSVVILACAFGRFSWLSARPLTFLGAISFSVYLTHPFVIALGKRAGLADKHWAGAVLFAGVVALATAAYRAIEVPSIKLGHRVERAIIPHNQPRSSGQSRPNDVLPEGR